MLRQIIHTCNTMTVRQYSQYEEKHDLKLLFRRLSFLPTKWFIKQIEAFTTEFNTLFSSDSSSSLFRDIDKLLFQNKLIMLQTLSDAIYVHLNHKIELDLLKQKSGIRVEPDIKLSDYFGQVAELTGIEIKELKDIETFHAELNRLIDKYPEMFPEKAVEKGVKIMELYMACKIVLKVEMNMNMTLTELAEHNKQAIEMNRINTEMINKSKK